MDQAFKVESTPLRIDLSGISHNMIDKEKSIELPSARISSCSSSRSTEFQTVMDAFSTLKLNEAKTHENETTKCLDENGDTGRSLTRSRRNSAELTPGDLVMKFSQAPQRGRRKSLPSLGLVPVEIQYSVPTKMSNSRSLPDNMTRRVMGSELKSIQEIPKRGAARKTSLKMDNKPEGNVPRRRRFSLDPQQNMNTPSGAFGQGMKQRRASCSTIVENPSEWRVKVFKKLDISDEDNTPLYPDIRSRRSSYSGFSGFSSQPQGRPSLFPRIGRRNSLVGKEKPQPHTRYPGI